MMSDRTPRPPTRTNLPEQSPDFTEHMFRSVVLALLVASASNRANISDLTQSGTNLVSNQATTTARQPITFNGAVSILFNDFGQLEVIPSRFLGNDRVFLIDPDHVAVGAINGRNFVEQEIAPTGDAQKRQILCEWTLVPDAPKAHAVVFGLNGS